MTSNLFVPHIVQPTRFTSHSKTLIDNIYSNCDNFMEGISGNLTIAISDHLAQFLIIEEDSTKVNSNSNHYKRDYAKFKKDDFLMDFLAIDFDEISSYSNDLNNSFNLYFDQINDVIDKHLPLRKMTKKEVKSKFKPWITYGLRNSMRRRDFIYRKFLREKNIIRKNELELQYKLLRNQILNICRVSKKLHFQNYFHENSNNIRNTWKGINQLICNKSHNSRNCTSLNVNNNVIFDQKEMASSFNKFFTTIADKPQKKIYNTGLNHKNYLHNPNTASFSISPTNSTEIVNIIDNLDSKKATGISSLPYDILKLIKNTLVHLLSKLIN